MRILAAAFLVCLAALCLAATASAEPIKVVASFSILADLARNAGGDKVAVVAIIGPEGDPHGYEPRPSDARKLADASVLIVNGLGLDSWLDRLATASGFHGIRVVASSGVTPILHGTTPDPHAWQSVPNAIAYVHAIAAGLATARPSDGDAIGKSSEAYEGKLRALDVEIRETLSPIPQAARRAIVPHRAFDYFGREYGIAFLAPLGTNADAEPTGTEMASLVEAVRKGAVRAIFTEHLEDNRAAESIAAETGLPIAAELYSDCLSRPGGPAPTYVDLMRHNAEAVAKALGSGTPH